MHLLESDIFWNLAVDVVRDTDLPVEGLEFLCRVLVVPFAITQPQVLTRRFLQPSKQMLAHYLTNMALAWDVLICLSLYMGLSTLSLYHRCCALQSLIDFTNSQLNVNIIIVRPSRVYLKILHTLISRT